MDVAQLLDRVREYIPSTRMPLIEEAYAFAAQAHAGQYRVSGEPFLQHPLHTAFILTELQMDATGLAAALLHDVVEDCGVELSELEERFGPDVAHLVDGVTKLGKLTLPAAPALTVGELGLSQAENLRKMLVAMAQDLRVVLIKQADRLHNMRTLSALPPVKRRQIAQETLEIYAPLAHRLGIWQIKWQLEDLAFRHLEPQRYREVARLVATKRASRERYLAQVVRILREEFEKAGIKAEVVGRPKNLYSIKQKIDKYTVQGKDFSDIYDLLALRVLVPEVQDCYAALGVIHNLWRPLPNQFDDYIANSKDNMYQSLHTAVMCLGARPLEIQIRTYEMHRVAEYGIASHWTYKEGGGGKDRHFEQKVAWLRQLMDWQRELAGAEEFVESVKTDIFQDRVFVYTPKGEIKDLPAGATPLDFAYLIHTDLGHYCIGAKVNGKLVPLNTRLRSGDTAEILTAKGSRGPSLDWLNPNLGYLNTSSARQKVRVWFKRQQREENIARGREILDREMRRLGVTALSFDEIARSFKYDDVEDFLAAVGYGDVNVSQIVSKLAAQEERGPEPLLPMTPVTPTRVSPGIEVLGVGDLLTQIARCCEPVPGDDIMGYVTRTRGVTVHRKDCPNIINAPDKERLIKVNWGRGGQLYPVVVRIEAWDRVGLLRDVTTVISEEKVNMTYVSTVTHPDRTATIEVTVETTGIGQLSRLFSKLEGVRGITGVARAAEVAAREAG